MDARTIPIIPPLIGARYGPMEGQPARSGSGYKWWLNQFHWTFSFGLYRNVLLRRLSYVLHGDAYDPVGRPLDNITHYYRPNIHGPLTPSWTSVAVDYDGVSDLVALHNVNRHPSADKEWRMSFIHYSSQIHHPGSALGQIKDALCLFLLDVPQNELIEGCLWYYPYAIGRRGFIPRKPLVMTAVDGIAASITVTPR